MKFELINYQSIDSTNEEAKRLIRFCSTGNLIITSKEQLAGRGRSNREWVSKPGNLYMSIVLCDPAFIAYTDCCFIAALSIYHSVVAAPNNMFLKWPNDIIINDKKAAGILIESTTHNQKIFLIIGIGVNILSHPQDVNKPTTSLLQENINITPDRLLHNIIKNFKHYYILYQAQGFEIIRQAWLKHAYKLGKEVQFHLNNKIIQGIFTGIDETGNILLQMPNGAVSKFALGEILG